MINRRLLMIAITILLLFLTGCSEQTEDIDENIAALQLELDTVKQSSEDMKTTLETLNSDLVAENDDLSAEKIALQDDIDAALAAILLLDAYILELELEVLNHTIDIATFVEHIEELEEYVLELETSILSILDEIPEVYTFIHINGHGLEEEYVYEILFEWGTRDYVKYQITYLSCNCRSADTNFYQVAYVEINRYSNDIRFISFDLDSSGYYSPGTWGDSNPLPSGKTLEDFETEFIPWLIGKSLTDLDGISVFTNSDYHGIQNTTNIVEQLLIDSYAGSSVSTNNMIRVMKELLEYHEEKYPD